MEFHREALEIVLAAGRELTGRRGADHIKEKGHTDYVTEVDVRVQQFIFRELSKIDPGAQFLGEEKDNSGVDTNGRVWILDPVDGTTNFIHDFQHSVIGLVHTYKLIMDNGQEYTMTIKDGEKGDKGDAAYLWQNVYDPESGLIEMDLTLFVSEDGGRSFRRMFERHVQKAHEVAELCTLLERCGFCEIECFDAFTLRPPRAESERVQFFAHRR